MKILDQEVMSHLKTFLNEDAQINAEAILTHILQSPDVIPPQISNHERNSIVAYFKRHGIKEIEHSFRATRNHKFTFIDLFAGIGGFRIAMQELGGKCVFSSEWDKWAKQTYYQNYGEVPFGDITKIDPKQIPNHDILCAGFPCQPFSHAGLKKGIEDTRGTLFHTIAKIIEAKKPKVAILENVRGLISHDKGRTLQIILRSFIQLGYQCNIAEDIILNGSMSSIQDKAKEMVVKSVHFGVPQNRQRIVIVLWKKSLHLKSFQYPTPMQKQTRVGEILEVNPSKNVRLSDALWQGHQRRKEQNKINGKGFGYGIVKPDSPYTNTISARYYKDGSEILIDDGHKNPRKLTVREAARLQGFPDEFLPCSSSVQAYKQFGNSVTVAAIKAIGFEITKQIL